MVTTPPSRRPTLTVAVLTQNEAHGIEACLRSAGFADQVVVVDSGSTDDTVAIARGLGAEVYVYPDWQGFAVQRNRLLAHSTGDYVFFLDADEVIGSALQQEMAGVVASGRQGVWRVRWRTVAFGRELKHFISQSKVERLFCRGTLVGFDGVVHERAEVHPKDLPRAILREGLWHHSRQTVAGSLQKLAQYSMLGAFKRESSGKKGGVVRGLVSGISIFLRLYVLHLGFLCGGAGFLYCAFVGLEGFFRYAALHYDKNQLKPSVMRI